jgi:tagatose-6-phosphate ketose/aldose isomerase
MHFTGFSRADTERAGAHWTTREIAQQPAVWRTVAAMAGAGSPAARFLAPLLQDPALRIVLTGAGSSAFVGQSLAPALTRGLQRPVAAVATTDLVAGPANWLLGDAPTLLVSFARSGSSPESVAALEMTQRQVRNCHHLVVTCNARGALHEIATRLDNAHVLLLPEACNDNSLAMTSSFTSMLLAAGLAFGVVSAGDVALACDAAQHVLDHALPLMRQIVRAGFGRVVYLGANEHQGLAREAALKMLELTDGRVVSLADTPLGFRHGPKTIVNSSALVVVFISSDRYSRQYDLDLLQELRNEGAAGRVLALVAEGHAIPDHADNFILSGLSGAGALASGLPCMVFGQFLALLQSITLGITPDNPSPTGAINRVVKGVTIYPLERAG